MKVLSTLSVFFLLSFANSSSGDVVRIGFGSCGKEDKPQPIWGAVNAEGLDAFVFLGDNIYADTLDPKVIEKKYQRLNEIPGFKRLRESTPVYAIWDDHDYGQNDAGIENPIKHESRKIMLDFWQETKKSPRYTQEGGIYTAYYLGEGDERIQILLPDLRWNRTSLNELDPARQAFRFAQNMGPYDVQFKEHAEFLGEAQWQWLEDELQKPAKIRILGSSLQLLADFTGWESWANFPKDKQRLFEIVKRHKVEGLLIISGDTHWAEISEFQGDLPYPLFDITSSGLTEEWHQVSPNKNRISKTFTEANYGVIEIDFSSTPVSIALKIKNVAGENLIEKTVWADQLKIPLK